MVLNLKHAKVSAVADSGDASLVQPSDWNADHTLAGTKADFNAACTDDDFAFVGTAQSWTQQQTFKELKETVFTITDGAGFEIDPANGTIQLVTLGGNRTPLATNFEAGQAVTLMIDDGAGFTITWTSILANANWVGGTPPTLATSGYTVVVLWKVGSTVRGKAVGNVT